MYPIQIDNHVSEMQNLLLSQFKNSPNILALVEVYGDQIQDLEIEYFKLLDSLGIDTATDYALDLIGKEVQESRQGRNDADYRMAILTKIFLNTVSGTPEEVISATTQITGATGVNYSEQYPAGVVLEVLGAEYVSKAPTIRRILPAGVDLSFQKDLGLDVATTYGGAALTQQVTFESNPVYTDLIVGGYLVSTGQLSEDTLLYQP